MGSRLISRRRFLGVGLAGAAVGLLPGCAPSIVRGGEQRGLALPTWERHGYRDFDTASALHDLRATGARWVQIVPTWFQDTLGAVVIRPTASSVEIDDVRYAIGLARSAGLRVLLKPHVDVLDGSDRARIAPDDLDGWFRSYREFLGRWAVLAHDEDVEEFSIGTELSSLAGERARWLDVVTDVRGCYGGRLVYAANYYEYRDVSFWDAVDLIGINAYWRLETSPTTDVSRLERAFAPISCQLAAFSARAGRRILFTEAGFPSQTGAATAPWDDVQSTVPAQDEQAAAYRALLATFTGQRWWAGVFWWTWTVPHAHSLEVPFSLDHSARDKAAADVLREAWNRPAL